MALEAPFSSDKHAQLLLSQMNQLRACSDFCDVQLQVEEVLFPVHRLVLAASSPYFAALFGGGMREASTDVVPILGVDVGCFRLLLEFVYTGVVTISTGNVQELLVAADMLQLSEVAELCCRFLKAQMEPSNVVGIFQLAHHMAQADLMEAAECYIHAHFLEVQNEEEFLALGKEELVKILQSLTDFSLRVALQTLLREFCEIHHFPKDSRVSCFLHASKVHPRRKARKYLYVVGGYTRLQGGRWSDSRALSCVERFDTFSQYWTTVSSLHQARSGLGVAALNGMMYVVGGEKESMIFDCTECYNHITRQWTAVASMNYPRCGLGVCTCLGAIYALGGWIGAEIGNTVERYDPEENLWQLVGSMPLPRYYFGCCEMQGLIYVIGGISNEGIELRTAEIYNPITKQWAPLPSMETRRAYLGVATLNDCIYAVGGWNEREDALSTVEKYSPHEEKWVEVAAMKVPRAGVSVVAVNGFLYATGGRSSSQDFSAPVTSDSVEVYNPHTDTWTEIGNMITSRCEGGMAVV
uniref:Actin-binding protein IPP isoform X3 n=1 Tax=Geotrypetes seraphini TaxID=260995 RepID=A0A6P8N6X5_GEOSA|nr:actin-binding protein IPP isoform X3 [Geotrypetes seraphini]